MKDTIVEKVIEQFKQRSEVGINKYGVTLDRTDLSRLDWINHAQEEAMDFILYLEKLKTFESNEIVQHQERQNQNLTWKTNQTY